jgi:HEAT repeat protein
MTSLGLLVSVGALPACLLVLFGSAGAARLYQGRRRRRRARAVTTLRPAVAGIIAAEDGSGAEQLALLSGRLRRAERRALTEVVLGYLAKIRGPARQPLLDLLVHDGTVPRAYRDLHARSWVRRARGADILGRAGPPAAAEELAALLTDPVAEVRALAAAGLPTVLDGEKVEPWIVEALLRTTGSARRLPAGLIVEVLHRLGSPVTPTLLVALHTGPDEVREIAAQTLGLLGATGGAEAAAGLAEAVHEPGGAPAVRARAATALGRLGLPAAVDPLLGALEEEQVPVVRRAAVTALADLGSPAAIEPLARLLDAGHPLATDAAAALGRLGSRGVDALEAVHRDRPGSAAARFAVAELARRHVRTQRAGRPGGGAGPVARSAGTTQVVRTRS